jgi:hypothetical protein
VIGNKCLKNRSFHMTCYCTIYIVGLGTEWTSVVQLCDGNLNLPLKYPGNGII